MSDRRPATVPGAGEVLCFAGGTRYSKRITGGSTQKPGQSVGYLTVAPAVRFLQATWWLIKVTTYLTLMFYVPPANSPIRDAPRAAPDASLRTISAVPTVSLENRLPGGEPAPSEC